MAKGNKKDRQEKSVNQPKEYHDLSKGIFKIVPINESEGHQFQEMFNLNKDYSASIDQFKMHEFALIKKREEITNYKSGKWPSKLILMLNKVMSREVTELDEILSILEREESTIDKAMDNLRCQVEMKRDALVETMLRNSSILKQKIGDFEIKRISAARNTGPEYSDMEKERIKKEVESTSVEELEKEVKAKK